jgi:S1-C subfamily serine protease
MVAQVEGGSQGTQAGLRVGDIVTEINLAPVRTKADFEQIEKAMTGSKRPLLLRVFRGREVFYTTVEP